jgi:glycosyltransferase involved in cell wall biosynthesis
MERVTIIIPFYNCAYVDQAIKSALNQTYENLEIIVVNDGSDRYEDKLKPYLDRIRYIKKGNGGTATALNLGIRNATGKYITWLSSDDLYERDKVTKQVAFMKKRKASVSYSSYFLIDSENRVTHGPTRVGFPNKISFYERLKSGCPINGCTVMLHQDVYTNIGLFDPNLLFTHDYDMWLRIVPRYDFHYIEEPIAMHRVHEQMGTKKFKEKIEKEILYVKNKHRFVLDGLITKESNR